MKEQSLNSTPKISIPDTSLVGLKKSEPEKEVTEESTKLPMPTGWRLLILPFKMKDKTKGGIIMNDTTLEKQQVGSQCGNVLAVGPEAYKGKRFENSGPWCKKGDWVVFRAYSGTRMKMYGQEFRLINDDTVEAVVSDPTGVVRA